MLDNIFGSQYNVATAIDAYLDRMTKVIHLKKISMEVNEGALSDEMTDLIITLVKLTHQEAKKSLIDFNKDEDK